MKEKIVLRICGYLLGVIQRKKIENYFMARQNFKIYRNKYYFKVHNVWETIFIHQFYLKKKKKTEKNL